MRIVRSQIFTTDLLNESQDEVRVPSTLNVKTLLIVVKAECGECDPIEWTRPAKGTRVDPPADIVVIVVDFSGTDNVGAFNIFEANDKQFAKIGMEERGRQIIVRWKQGWWYYVAGSLRVGYVREKKA